MMGRSWVAGVMTVVGLMIGTTSVAEAHDPHCHHPRRGYGVAIGVGYVPRGYYVAPPPPPVYGPPLYHPPGYVVPYYPYPAYPYAPYPASGVGVSTRSFGLWIGR